MTQDWFASWFDTPYYHMLYQYRDDTEARAFIDALCEYLKPQKEHHILDLACGRGRHAIYLNKQGLDVVGYDLAEENISYAKQFENDRLRFDVKDMRNNLGTSQFDFVFNLFTSFGYFEDDSENEVAMRSIAKSLKNGGRLVLDFMNIHQVESGLIPEEAKSIQGVTFNIHREIDAQHITKQISVSSRGRTFKFEERVRKLTLKDFKKLFERAGLTPVAIFGNLNLETFEEQSSDRLIMIVEKP